MNPMNKKKSKIHPNFLEGIATEAAIANGLVRKLTKELMNPCPLKKYEEHRTAI